MIEKVVQSNDFNVDKDDITYNIILDKLLNKRASEFVSIRDGIVPHIIVQNFSIQDGISIRDGIVYNFKAEGEILKDFTNYEMPLELF